MKNSLSICCLAFLSSSLCVGQIHNGNASLTFLVESERIFAKTSVEKGARPAFMQFFADDAMVFRPHPVKYKEAMKNVPMPKNPLESTLNWEPVYADVSKSGELGYTTGPSEWTDHSAAKRPPYYGFYFSFWKRQASGEWRVVFDVGTELPGPYGGTRTLRSPAIVERKRGKEKIDDGSSRSSLMRAEGDFLKAEQKSGTLRALDMFVDAEARIYRQKENPIVGKEAYQRYFSAKPYLSTWAALGCDVAKSGELGYVYGSYVAKGIERKQVNGEKGYYLRAWKRNAEGSWRLVAEVLSPLPPEVPKPKE